MLTDDQRFAGEARVLGDQGRGPDGVHRRAGTNCRMSELQAALGTVQLDRFAEHLARRRAIALRYDEWFAGHRRQQAGGVVPNHYKYWLELPSQAARDAFAAAMHERGIDLPGPLAGHAEPIHQQPAFSSASAQDPLPDTERFSACHACLPLYPGLSRRQVDRVIDAARAALRTAGTST